MGQSSDSSLAHRSHICIRVGPANMLNGEVHHQHMQMPRFATEPLNNAAHVNRRNIFERARVS